MRALQLFLILLLAGDMTASAGAKLEIIPDKLDFGRVPQYTKYYRKVVLKSTGDTPVRINKVNSFCDCILVPFNEATILPGDSLVAEIEFFSASYSSDREWRPHFYYNGPERDKYIRVMADIVIDHRKLKPIYVNPHSIVASQYGDSVQREFPLYIINVTSETVPLKLIYNDDEFYDLDFPLYILPHDTAVGKITLNDRGIASEFEKSITFEYINEKSEEKHYSIPVRRKIFKPNGRK